MPTPAKPNETPARVQTRDRLLEAAAEVFCEKGFLRGTVQEITERAGANIAAVNYHFGDKQGLYEAAIKHWVGVALQTYPPDMDLGDTPTPEERLHAFVRSFLFRLLAEGQPAWHGRLITREMVEPTAALGTVLTSEIRPLVVRLEGIVRDLIGRDTGPEPLHMCMASIVGQCVFYRHAEPMIARMFPDLRHDPAGIERLAGHVTKFTLAGLREYREMQNEE